jgi:hypothetical protein
MKRREDKPRTLSDYPLCIGEMLRRSKIADHRRWCHRHDGFLAAERARGLMLGIAVGGLLLLALEKLGWLR